MTAPSTAVAVPDALDRALSFTAGDRPPVVLGPADGIAFLQQWAQATGFLAGIARTLARTPFIPQSLRAARTSREQTEDELFEITVSNVTACILSGQELGLHPMAALRSVDVIKGTPALRALAMRALVQSHGHRLTLIESTESYAVIEGQRKGEDKPVTVRFSTDQARSLGLLGNDNWKKQPGNMCIARATTGAARLIAADVLLAIPYSVEELDDGLETVVPATDTQPEIVRPARKTAQRATTPAKAAATGGARRGAVAAPPTADVDSDLDFSNEGGTPSEPSPETPSPSGGGDDNAAAPSAPSAPPNVASEKQRRRVLALCSDLQLTNRDRRLIVLGAILSRRVTTTDELTTDEAVVLGDTLEALARRGAEGRAEVDGIYQEAIDRAQDEAYEASQAGDQ